MVTRRQGPLRTQESDVYVARIGGRRLVGPADRQVLGLAVTVKLVLFVFAYLAYPILTGKALTSLRAFLEIWNRWDAPHYLDLARYGYATTGPTSDWIVFFPLFPTLTHVTALAVRDYLTAAFVVSTLASLALAVVFYQLVLTERPSRTAQDAVWFLYIFPTSYFLHIGYTESLFLVLVTGAFLAARTGQWWLAGPLGGLAALTRVNGVLLIPALLMEAVLQYRNDRRWRWDWLWIAIVGSGLISYLWLNYKVYGDPLAFLAVQDRRWSKSATWPWVGIQKVAAGLSWRPTSEAGMVAVQELIYIAIGLAASVAAWWKLRSSYAVWMTGNWLLFTSTSFVLSVPRYTLTLFPLFILLADMGRNRSLHTALTTWSLLFMAFFASLFIQGKWGF